VPDGKKWRAPRERLRSPAVHFVREERTVAMRLVSGHGHYDSVIEAVRKARDSVWIATANLKEVLVEDGTRRRRRAFRSMLDVFDELCQRGVELRLLHASMPSLAFRRAFDKYPSLVAGGLELRACARVHLKAVIVDAQLLYLGSANWTGAGLGVKHEDRRNFELGLVTSDSAMLDEVQYIYDRIWRGGECGRCKLRDRCEAPLDR
jgi:phosphatidylserine/phosphatidylglycerophosphate/cardiolipin synthase-like enzyme